MGGKAQPVNRYESAVAVISDVHGNRWALEAVLHDVRERGIPRMVILGDCVFGPLDPPGDYHASSSLPFRVERAAEGR